MLSQDLATIGLLIFLEGVLSIDNAVVLALLAGRLPKHLQKRALTYGMIGAFTFRFLALAMASFFMHWTWVKFVGGAYLLYLAIAHWIKSSKKEEEKLSPKKESQEFWKTVVLIELMDIAFAIDSILAAVAISPKFWVVYTGGIIGMICMRFSAGLFINLLKRFPSFEDSAYILVFIIGAKLIVDGFHFKDIDFHSPHSFAFWIFWIAMGAAILWGFKPKKTKV
ncbi:MAG: TerC family protein [Deltaproteobacteria bacterium]|nr:TerC family protein [Deltaproteobacteria bacterium]